MRSISYLWSIQNMGVISTSEENVWHRYLKLALGLILEQGGVPGVWVKGEIVDGVLLTGPTEQILVHLSVIPTETAVKLPVGNGPGVDEANSVRADLIEKIHHSGGASQGNLSHGDSTR